MRGPQTARSQTLARKRLGMGRRQGDAPECLEPLGGLGGRKGFGGLLPWPYLALVGLPSPARQPASPLPVSRRYCSRLFAVVFDFLVAIPSFVILVTRSVYQLKSLQPFLVSSPASPLALSSPCDQGIHPFAVPSTSDILIHALVRLVTEGRTTTTTCTNSDNILRL